MFRKLSRSGSLSAQTSDYEAWIGFGGAIAQVAQVHQFGLKDRPARHAREIRYARRELLGMTAQDRENLLDAVIAHITNFSDWKQFANVDECGILSCRT